MNYKTTNKAECSICTLGVYNEKRGNLLFITFFFVCHFKSTISYDIYARSTYKIYKDVRRFYHIATPQKLKVND